jgi:hypothetical protein
MHFVEHFVIEIMWVGVHELGIPRQTRQIKNIFE